MENLEYGVIGVHCVSCDIIIIVMILAIINPGCEGQLPSEVHLPKKGNQTRYCTCILCGMLFGQ